MKLFYIFARINCRFTYKLGTVRMKVTTPIMYLNIANLQKSLIKISVHNRIHIYFIFSTMDQELILWIRITFKINILIISDLNNIWNSFISDWITTQWHNNGEDCHNYLQLSAAAVPLEESSLTWRDAEPQYYQPVSVTKSCLLFTTLLIQYCEHTH